MKVFRSPFLRILIALAASQPLWAAAPVIDPPVPLDGLGQPSQVAPSVPIGKALLFPITATDSDGDRLTFTVSSSNPNIRVRVRTGHPKLKLLIDHAGDGSATDPAFSGTLEFSLLRDLTPITTGFIGGFAQGNFYNGNIFHRIADLSPSEDANGSFIFQAGDPLKGDPDDPLTPREHGPGFRFDNEFNSAMIFSGRGQLAMANAGFTAATFKGTNGSQFFITDGGPRFLDFNHTIFGQLLRGWNLQESLRHVTRFPAPTSPAIRPPQDLPMVDVTITSATVEPDFADAILLITAIAPGTATITVEASDGSATDTKTFTVTAFKDTINDPPFVQPVPNQNAAVGKIHRIPLGIVDLEHDYVFASNQVLSPFLGQSGGGNPALILSSSAGAMNLGIKATQYDMTFRNATLDGAARATDDQVAVAIAVGDKPITAKSANVSGAPGIALADLAVATFTDSDALGQVSEYTAQINWGDGTAPSAGTIVRDPARPLPTAFLVRGAHTYGQPGIYPLVVDLTATKGQRATVRGSAVITSGPLRAFGRIFRTAGAKLADGVVANFTDDSPGAPLTYSAKISWGDGTHSDGTIRLAPAGEFQVLGSHTFSDPEDYSVVVRIHKAGADPSTDAYAWSTAEARRFIKPAHLPPFATPNLIGQFSANGSSPLRATTGNQTFATGQLIVLNAGNRTCPSPKIRFYLSEDTTLNLQDETAPDPDHPGETIVVNPKDKLVTILGTESIPLLSFTFSNVNPRLAIPKEVTELSLQALAPGAGVRFVFDKTSAGDTRLKFPAGETGAGLNLLAHFVYSHPIADQLPIERNVVFGPYDPFIVKPTSLIVRELGGDQASAKFKVKLARQPRATVSIPITLSTTDQVQIMVDKTELVFTPSDWNDETHEVTVTAKDDATTDGTKSATVKLGLAVSTDIRFNNLDPTDVSVTVLDKEDPFTVTPTSLTVQEASATLGSAKFKVKLTRQPGANVTIPITLSATDQTQITVDKTELVFTPSDWNSETHEITVTATDDGVADGTVSAVVVLGLAVSTDLSFDSHDPKNVNVNVLDKATP